MFDRQLTRQKLRLEQENVRMLRERMIEMENDRLYQDNIAKSKNLANAHHAPYPKKRTHPRDQR